MDWNADYEPSPWDIISDQVALYEKTGGKEGDTLEGKPCVILWSLGAKSGKVRKSPLMRVEHEGSYAVIGSMGGAPNDPQWVHNLRTHGVCRVQDGPAPVDLTARQAEGDEKAVWWARATEVWPSYDTYQASTDRVIPLFVLEP
jgi:deazaflavin-dependent oxidoreductase (nitroreductase family)